MEWRDKRRPSGGTSDGSGWRWETRVAAGGKGGGCGGDKRQMGGGVGAGGGTSDGQERYAGGGGVRQRASRDAEARLHGERDAEANRRGVQAIYSSDLQQRYGGSIRRRIAAA